LHEFPLDSAIRDFGSGKKCGDATRNAIPKFASSEASTRFAARLNWRFLFSAGQGIFHTTGGSVLTSPHGKSIVNANRVVTQFGCNGGL
jgi:hypothetical protein